MSREPMKLSIESIPGDDLEAVENLVAEKLRDILGLPQHTKPEPKLSQSTRSELANLGILGQVKLPKAEKVATFESLTDGEYEDWITTRLFEDIVAMSEEVPGVVFRLFAYGDEDGGWPWIVWVQDGKVIEEWESSVGVPESLEDARGVPHAITPDNDGKGDDAVRDFTLQPGYTAWLTVGDIELQIAPVDGQLNIRAYRKVEGDGENPELTLVVLDLGGE